MWITQYDKSILHLSLIKEMGVFLHDTVPKTLLEFAFVVSEMKEMPRFLVGHIRSVYVGRDTVCLAGATEL